MKAELARETAHMEKHFYKFVLAVLIINAALFGYSLYLIFS